MGMLVTFFDAIADDKHFEDDIDIPVSMEGEGYFEF